MPSAWQIRGHPPQDWKSPSTAENLRLVHNLPKLTPGAGSVLLNIKAAALNYRDLLLVAHSPAYPALAVPDLVPCADAAGVVEAVGPGSKWKVGDRVLVNSSKWVDGPAPRYDEAESIGSGALDGTLREYAVFADSRLISFPDHLSFVEAASLGGAAGTAINTLFCGPLPFEKGSTVVTQGTGGVSAFIIQLAAAAGATVIATSSSDTKLEIARSLGATHLVNYKTTPDWAAEVLRITHGRGADHVVDVAGAGTIEQSLQASKQGGMVSVIGFLTDSKPTDLIVPIILGAKVVRGILGVSNVMLEKLGQLYEEHQLRPPIAKVFKWNEAREAYAALREFEGVGKIVIEVGA